MLEDKLRCLSSFLSDYLARRQSRGSSGAGSYSRYSPMPPPLQQQALPAAGLLFSPSLGDAFNMGMGAGMGGGMGGGEGLMGQGAAKRQRLTHAAALEDERTARVR